MQMRCLGLLALAACGGCDREDSHADARVDAGGGELAVDGAVLDAGLAPCPSSGRGAIRAPGPCFVFTPVQAGAAASGDNAQTDHYALEPSAGVRGELVVYLNASLATPAVQIADPDLNLYGELAAHGFHVLARAYRSTTVIGAICADDLDCYGPTRETLIRGRVQPGSASELADMREDEAIVYRLAAALRTLASARPGWSAFVDPSASAPEQQVQWQKLAVAGHSQGGGHAAYLGKLFALRRVVQLSSTCDAIAGTPAPWTTGSWATPPATAFYGLAVPTTFAASGLPIGGDTTCAWHARIWQTMGMASANMHDDAATCAGATAHTSVVQCTSNAPRWAPLFE